MNAVPRLSIGLPVYNGERYVADSIQALLGQSYTEFELIISDNASTDATAAICQEFARQDSRIRYFRQPRNIGLAPNHNFVFAQARGELFKMASGDDLYATELVERCVEALDQHPHVVLAHSWTATIDGADQVIDTARYSLTTASPQPSERFRSMLFDTGSDDDYGVIRTEVLHRTRRLNSYHHADRTNVAEIGLHGPFYQVPDWLYFRRDHPERAERANPTIRSRCVNLDPRRADRFRHPVARLYAEYIWGYAAAIRRAPLSAAERNRCYQHLTKWVASRTRPAEPGPEIGQTPHLGKRAPVSVAAVVAGRGEEAS